MNKYKSRTKGAHMRPDVRDNSPSRCLWSDRWRFRSRGRTHLKSTISWDWFVCTYSGLGPPSFPRRSPVASSVTVNYKCDRGNEEGRARAKSMRCSLHFNGAVCNSFITFLTRRYYAVHSYILSVYYNCRYLHYTFLFFFIFCIFQKINISKHAFLLARVLKFIFNFFFTEIFNFLY